MRNRWIVLGAALAALVAAPMSAGEYHTDDDNVCTDCHTMHFSMAHNWDSATAPGTTPVVGGNWLSATGPNLYLLKGPVNTLCLNCHDGQTFAPDVLGNNTNAGSQVQGRRAGALNHVGGVDGYQEWMGHTLDSTDDPPGYNPAAAGFSATTYDTGAGQLECINCHRQHGSAGVYRNLMPRRYGNGTGFNVSYVLSTTNDGTKDVWINTATRSFPDSNPATRSPYYDEANILYNRNTYAPTSGGTGTVANLLERHCASCHGDFHGAPTESWTEGTVSTNGTGPGGVGGVAVVGPPAGFDEFIRHPSNIDIGLLGGGHSTLSRYTGTASIAKVKVYASYTTPTTWSGTPSPGCVSCHKSHGNLNPFGLVFLDRTATTIGEQGGYAPAEIETGPLGYEVGYRNLCGQCHGQGD